MAGKILSGVERLVSSVAVLPFVYAFSAPKMRLQRPSSPLFMQILPTSTVVLALAFLSYFCVVSGIIYDIIVEPPSVGSGADGRPIAFLQYRINGQFIIEGLSAGMLFALGGAGLIILDKSTDKYLSQRNRYLMFLSGAICVVAAYALSLVFIHMKVPGYMD